MRSVTPGGAQQNEVMLLDCTIRDGSYAIDFKFSPSDAALVAGLLDDLGLPYIEIGHGLGLGGGGGGDAGAVLERDRLEIERARPEVSRGRLGAFFIPGIGDLDNLSAAAASGLDFVRVGQNADELDDVWRYVEYARALGLEVFVNLMKTYGVAPAAFADAAVRAADHGVAAVYVVDSAGGMLPDEVKTYVTEARARSSVPIGFHGHSNLHLGVANSLAALEAGATFVDTSLYGIGRSSGNVPTEVFVALLDRLGIDVGIDPIAVIEAAEQYVQPLAEHLHPHTMTAVSLGFGRFHSSYLPTALAAAEQAGVSPLRLIVELGKRDVMRLSDELLAEVVADLGNAPAAPSDSALARFSHPSFGPRRIRRDADAVEDLLQGLESVAAKRRLQVVLDLVASPRTDDESITAEFVLEDRFMSLGRIRYGSIESLEALLDHVGPRLHLGLLDVDAAPGPFRPTELGQAARRAAILPYRSHELALTHLADVALALVWNSNDPSVTFVDSGYFAPDDVAVLASRLGGAAHVSSSSTGGLVVVAGPLTATEAETFAADQIVCLETGTLTSPKSDPRVLRIPVDDAYRGRLPGWRQALETAKSHELDATASR